MFSLSTHANYSTRTAAWPTRFFGSTLRLLRAFETAARWRETLNERRMLVAMSDRELRDFGLTRADAIREAETPPWR